MLGSGVHPATACVRTRGHHQRLDGQYWDASAEEHDLIVAVFGDVHANLPALETFLGQVEGHVDAYLCLGDVVNYGPWNDECLERITALPEVTLLEGNHERLFLDPVLV